MIASGCTSYIFGLFVVPVTQEFGISRAGMNTGFIAMLLGAGILSPIVGRLLDIFSARKVMFSGGIGFGLGMLGIAFAPEPWLMVLAIFLPIAYGLAACGTLAGNTVVVRWFKGNRGKALGSLAVATSAGGFVFTPITALMIENFGWRAALMLIGIIALVVVSLMALLVIRDQPSGREKGYRKEFELDESKEDGSADENAEASDQSLSEQWSYTRLFRDKNFWLLTIGIGLLYGSDQALVTSTVPYFQDIGIDLPAAALIVSVMTLSAIGGKLLIGYLADKIDLRLVFLLVGVMHIALLLAYLAQPPYWALLGLAGFCGVGIGGVFPVWATLLAHLFGSGSYGTVMGLMTIILKLFSIVAVRMIGEIYDSTGSYTTAFYVFFVAIVVALVSVSFIQTKSN
jgi:sugar phosphate permease